MFSFSACDEEKDKNGLSRVPIESIIQYDTTNLDNLNNLFWRAGSIHNNAMDFVATNYSFDSNNTDSMLVDYMTEWLINIDLTDSIFVSDFNILRPQIDSIAQTINLNLPFINIYTNLNFNSNHISLTERIFNNISNEGESYSNLIDSLGQIENDIINISDTDSIQKTVLLVTISISKHSANYWYNYYNGLSNYKNKNMIKMASSWRTVLHNDAKGACIGAFAGVWGGLVSAAVSALVTPPPIVAGTGGAIIVASIARGAVMGAITGSMQR